MREPTLEPTLEPMLEPTLEPNMWSTTSTIKNIHHEPTRNKHTQIMNCFVSLVFEGKIRFCSYYCSADVVT